MQTSAQPYALDQFLQAKEQTEFLSIQVLHRKMSVVERETDRLLIIIG